MHSYFYPQDHLSVLVFGKNMTLLRHVCAEIVWPLPACGDREEPLVHVESNLLISAYDYVVAPDSISELRFSAFPSEDLLVENGQPVLKLYINGEETLSQRSSCYSVEPETVSVPNTTEEWPPLLIHCSIDTDFPTPQNSEITMMEVVAAWTDPESGQVLGLDSMTFSRVGPDSWVLPTDPLLVSNSFKRPPKYLIEVGSMHCL